MKEDGIIVLHGLVVKLCEMIKYIFIKQVLTL
jgi:hypothetical protein